MHILPRHNIRGTLIISGGTLVLGDKQRLTPSLQNVATLVSQWNQNHEISIYNDSLRCSQGPQKKMGSNLPAVIRNTEKAMVSTAELRQFFLLCTVQKPAPPCFREWWPLPLFDDNQWTGCSWWRVEETGAGQHNFRLTGNKTRKQSQHIVSMYIDCSEFTHFCGLS